MRVDDNARVNEIASFVQCGYCPTIAPEYENYDEDLQAFNGTGVILTSEEIKELFNCKGEWEVTDGVTDMSF